MTGYIVSFRNYAKFYRKLVDAEGSAEYTANYSPGLTVQIYEQAEDGTLTHVKTVRVKRWNEK